MPYVPLTADPEPWVRTVPVDRAASTRMKAFRVVVLVLLLSRQTGSRWAQEEDGDVDSGQENYGYDDDDEDDEEENMIPGSRDTDFLQCYTCQSLQSGESCNQTQNCYYSKTFCTTIISHGETDNGLLTTYSMWCTDTCESITRTMSGTQVTQTCCQSTLCNIPPWQTPQDQDSLGRRAVSPVDSGAKNPQDGIAGSPLDDGVRYHLGGKADYPKGVKSTSPQSGGASLPKGRRVNPSQRNGAGYPPGWPKFGNTVLLLNLLTSLWVSGA